MDVFLWITFGLMSGALINVVRSKEGSVLEAMLIGALGAIAGGTLGSVIFNYKITTFSLATLLVAAIASLLFLYVERVFIRKSR